MAAAWIIMQAIGFVEAPLRLPSWADTLAIVLLIAGLPVAIILAWAQETQAPVQKSEPDDAEGARPAMVTDRPSIAVLPFNNMSGDEEHEYLADGMTEEIITLLAQFSNLFVIARNSTFAYKGTSPDIRDVGRDLGVRYVLEGSIRQVSDRIRITTQLIEAATGAHISAERYDRPLDEIFDVQDELAEAITGALQGQIMSAEHRAQAHASAENLNAWGLYIQFQRGQGTGSSPIGQIEILKQAVRLDPNFALAWANLASAQGFYGWAEELPDHEAEAERALERALTLAPRDPIVMVICADACSFFGRISEALELCLKAREAAPGSSTVLGGTAQQLLNNGRPGDAIDTAELALRLSPQDLNRTRWHTIKSRAFAQLGAHEQALEAAMHAVRLTPDWGLAGLCHANALGNLDRPEEARAVWQEFQATIARVGRKPVSVESYATRTRRTVISDDIAEAHVRGLRKAGIE